LTSLFSLEQKMDHRLGNGTRVVKFQSNHTGNDWSVEAIKNRKFNETGTIIGHHDSHGLCYDVRHDSDGSIGCYDPHELGTHQIFYLKAMSRETEIRLLDAEGDLIISRRGAIRISLLPGSYTATFEGESKAAKFNINPINTIMEIDQRIFFGHHLKI